MNPDIPNRQALMIADHFPPLQASSGIHRILKAVTCLPKYGSNADVLTVNRSALLARSGTNEALISKYSYLMN